MDSKQKKKDRQGMSEECTASSPVTETQKKCTFFYVLEHLWRSFTLFWPIRFKGLLYHYIYNNLLFYVAWLPNINILKKNIQVKQQSSIATFGSSLSSAFITKSFCKGMHPPTSPKQNQQCAWDVYYFTFFSFVLWKLSIVIWCNCSRSTWTIMENISGTQLNFWKKKKRKTKLALHSCESQVFAHNIQLKCESTAT